MPTCFLDWFNHRGWRLREYQLDMVSHFQQRRSTLLIAPTGGGKTLAGLLPSLMDCHCHPAEGLHTLYISPLKALTNDIARNLTQPIDEMGLAITVETRTGDTPSHKRQRQRKKPPNILLTTPESLMLMLSYHDAEQLFGKVKAIIIDEVHSFAGSKRGDFTTLALARLQYLAPKAIRFGLSATVAQPTALSEWLGPSGSPTDIIQAPASVLPSIAILDSNNTMPYSGFSARYAVGEIYRRILQAKTSIVFVNTRAQAEMMFQFLWEENHQALAIAIYHGSLDKEQRRKTEHLMATKQLRAIVSTSALELGIDWGDVDLVIQVGAPKGVSRLLQRIGRSNHRLDEPSQALLVPGNRFEAIECQSAIDAINKGELDSDTLYPGALDIIPQFLVNCACSGTFTADDVYAQICSAHPYRDLDQTQFSALLNFTVNGGYALQAYDRYQRLEQQEDGYSVASRSVAMRHRRNIGTIVEAARLRVKRLRRRHQGKIIGEVEEYFAQQLSPGDTFLFAGEVLAYEGINDMILEARPVTGGDPKIPAYVGGQMPLSTYLADAARALLNNQPAWQHLPEQVRDWIELQAAYSMVPPKDALLVEHFPYRLLPFTVFYTFEGRKANQTLGMLLTRRMETLGLKPLSFSINDYALSICSVEKLAETQLGELFAPDILGIELEEWIAESPMLKRAFRQVATVSGLTEQ
ncbi:MAG: ligase-associated DNA damage response DEXH box helicase, partial [Pseudomonadota bacterium]